MSASRLGVPIGQSISVNAAAPAPASARADNSKIDLCRTDQSCSCRYLVWQAEQVSVIKVKTRSAGIEASIAASDVPASPPIM
jgi:hypothetical protein